MKGQVPSDEEEVPVPLYPRSIHQPDGRQWSVVVSPDHLRVVINVFLLAERDSLLLPRLCKRICNLGVLDSSSICLLLGNGQMILDPFAQSSSSHGEELSRFCQQKDVARLKLHDEELSVLPFDETRLGKLGLEW